jgi:hypothetical protein
MQNRQGWGALILTCLMLDWEKLFAASRLAGQAEVQGLGDTAGTIVKFGKGTAKLCFPNDLEMNCKNSSGGSGALR